MIKDKFLKLLSIPILGIGISYMAGIFTYDKYSTAGAIGGVVYFMFVSFCIWRGCHWIHARLRALDLADQSIFYKIALICFTSSLYAISVSGIFCFLWMKISLENFSWMVINKFVLLSIFAVIVFTLIYEVLYLSKERELDNKIVNQLDNELTRAEMIALRNELDPHFIYNSLNTLSHFIHTDNGKAASYNQKLADLYRYFLANNNKELVLAAQEMNFIREYFGLLKMVYEERMYLDINVDEPCAHCLLIPCSLQLLVENAIKHNQFTIETPLHISISNTDEHIVIRNTIRPKQVSHSTKVGLRNLQAQYKLFSGKKIVIEKTDDQFIVKLPLIKAADKTMTKLPLAG
jgi:sensor histidine kinase YesM